MQRHVSAPDRPAGQTSGSPQRPPHSVEQPTSLIDLHREAEALRGEAAWREGDRNAKTFLKEADLRLALTVMKQEAVLQEHEVPGAATIQVLSGRIRFRAGGQTFELSPGQLLALGHEVRHDAEALEESAFVVTIAWRGGTRGDEARHTA